MLVNPMVTVDKVSIDKAGLHIGIAFSNACMYKLYLDLVIVIKTKEK